MKILVMAAVPEDPNSGAGGTIFHIVQALRELGHSVDMVWEGDLKRRIAHGNLHYLLELPREYRRALLARCRVRSYDVIDVSQPYGYLAAKALRGLPGDAVFVHRSHGLEPRRRRDLRRWSEVYGPPREVGVPKRVLRRLVRRALTRSERQIVRHADAHLLCSTGCARYLREEMGVDANRVGVVALGVPETFCRGVRPMSPSRLRRVLHVGQFAFFKAPMIVAEVMRGLAKEGADLEFTWVAPSRDHEAIRDLLGRETASRVHVLDWMTQDRLVRTYDEHGIFLFPSFFEGFGKVFLEAMSRGLCVVAADNSGAHDVIEDGIDGCLVETGDAEAMLERCSSLLEDPVRAARISAAAAKTASGYTWRSVAERTACFFHQCRARRA